MNTAKEVPRPMTAGELRDHMVRVSSRMDVGDVRPYATVVRYMGKNGFGLGERNGGLALIRNPSRPVYGGSISFPDVLSRCETYVRKQEQFVSALRRRKGNADGKGTFREMCVEEDAEELQVLKEAWHTVPREIRRNAPDGIGSIPIPTTLQDEAARIRRIDESIEADERLADLFAMC